jgi:SAM-dependent methyltransferase
MFGSRQARRDAQSYLAKGLDQPSRRVVEALKAQGLADASVLEIGGGAGGLHLDLLRAGASRAVNLDLSPAYLEAARQTAEKLGLADRVESRLHNLAEQPEGVAEADVVVMNRVICCYPDMERLVRPAAQRARRLLALTFPREAWWTRWGLRLTNGTLWLFRNEYRTYLHSPAAVFDLVASCGLSPIYQSFTTVWQIAVFQRTA